MLVVGRAEHIDPDLPLPGLAAKPKEGAELLDRRAVDSRDAPPVSDFPELTPVNALS